MNDEPAKSSSTRRKPSRSFASYPLRGAVEATKTAGASGADHSRDAFASYLGHDTTNSGGFKRKLASMKDWGLVETRGDRVVITDRGMRIAHPRAEDDEQSAIREAFLEADVFAETYRALAKDTELSLDRIGSMGVHEHGISPGAKADFARSFVESAAYVGLGQRNPDGSSIRLATAGGGSDGGAAGKTHEDRAGRDDRRGGGERFTRRPAREVSDGLPPTIHQEWDVESGSVLFEVRLDGPLPSTAFAMLAQVMQTVEKLVASLRPAEANRASTAALATPTENEPSGDAPE